MDLANSWRSMRYEMANEVHDSDRFPVNWTVEQNWGEEASPVPDKASSSLFQ